MDAGHGHWVHARADGTCFSPERADHQPVGIMGGAEFTTSTLSYSRGDRILIMTDGVVEQPGQDGEQFGMDRVHELLSTTKVPADDVQHLVDSVYGFASTDELADDTTIASIGLPME